MSSFKIQSVKLLIKIGLSYTVISENGKEKVNEMQKCLHNLPFNQTSSKMSNPKQSVCLFFNTCFSVCNL